MKSILFILGILIVSQSLQAQELKIKKVKSPAFFENIQFDKKTNQRQGIYQKIEKESNDTLVCGQFADDNPSGIWTYFDQNNNPYIRFDRDKDSLVWYSDLINRKDSFLLKIGNSFRLIKPDFPPLLLGAENEFRKQLKQQISVLKLAGHGEINGIYLFSFVIDIHGQITQLADLQGSSDSFKTEIHKILENPEFRWLPAKINGYPFESQFYLSLNVGSASPEPPKYTLPFVVDLNISNSGVGGTPRKVSLGYAIREVNPEELAKQKQNGSNLRYPEKVIR